MYLVTINGHITEEQKKAWWTATLFGRNCLAADNLDEAQLATEIALQVQPNPTDADLDDAGIRPEPVSAYFALDIFNSRAQRILNKALKAGRKLSFAARRDLKEAINLSDPTLMGQTIVLVISRYRIELAQLLGAAQLAAVLEGAKEIVDKLPKTVEMLEPPGAPPLPPLTFAELPEGAPERIVFPIIEAAARTLYEKKIVPRSVFDQLSDAARAKAFTVTGVDAQATMEKIRDALAENIAEGADYETFKKKIGERVEEGTFLSDSHQEVVFRTNVQAQFSDGQMGVLSHPLIRTGFPYTTYDAIHDDRVRPEHLAMEKMGIDGTNVFRLDDPVFQTMRPPWSWNCRCSWIPMTLRSAAERGISEAKTWLQSGQPPANPAFVKMPPFAPPPGFRRSINAAPLSIQLSLESLSQWSEGALFSQERKGTADLAKNAVIDEELWAEIQALIPPEWLEADRQAKRLMYALGFPSEFPHVLDPKIDSKITVSIVDGIKIMLTHDMDFTQGGNGEEDPGLCGKKQIVLDNQIGLPMVSDYKYILYHEAIERRKMEKEGWDYEKAHEYANACEKMLRERSKLLDAIDAAAPKFLSVDALLSIREYDEPLFERLSAHFAEDPFNSALHPRDEFGMFIDAATRAHPKAQQGAMVALKDIRKQMAGTHPTKQRFDAMVNRLGDQGKLDLHQHTFISSLTPEEVEQLVAGPVQQFPASGQIPAYEVPTHYIGAVIRDEALAEHARVQKHRQTGIAEGSIPPLLGDA